MRVKLFFIFTLALVSVVTAQAQNPVKLATQARFDLIGSASVGSMTNGYILAGDASIGRQTWLAAGEQPRSYTVSFTIVHFGWTEAAFKFTPASNGTVTLTLRGPWEMSPSNVIYRQEVLWDSCSATNTTINNGSFESVSGGIPVGWFRSYGDGIVDTNATLAEDGTRYIRAWHDGPFDYTFSVTNGVPVTLRFFARANFPTNFTDMARIINTNTPAHQAAPKFMRGANLGNWLDAPPGQDWGAHYTANDFVYIRSEGFDHVRLPIAWHYYTGLAPDYTLSNSIFANADFLVTNALNNDLAVLIDIHNYDAFATDPYGNTNKFYAIWRQLAAHYSNSPPQVAFELDNEPNGAATTPILNPIYAEAIRQIRLSNPGRTIFVGPSQWNSITELSNLQLPDADSNLVVTVHCYDPFYFTHQGASWGGPDVATLGVRFPGPPPTPLAPAAGIGSWATNWIADYNTIPTEGNPSSPIAFRSKLQIARQWSDYYGRPVHVGEFGAYSTYSDVISRARFYTEFRKTLDTLGLGWAMWDWKAGFHYWDDNTLQPVAGMRDAMFPRPLLNSTGPGRFNFDSSVAKTFVIQRTQSFSPTNWISIQTQTLTAPKLNFGDPAAGQNDAAFYRALWMK